jgi:hypothetical protein
MGLVPENELIDYAKKYLKEKGYKKKNKRWTKAEEAFTISFLIQGSCFDKEAYYIRPGIYINELDFSNDYYGHFWIEIKQDSLEQIFDDFEQFVSMWTDKNSIKKMVEWNKRNPIEKRRANCVNYTKDPVPSSACLSISEYVLNYIYKNF